MSRHLTKAIVLLGALCVLLAPADAAKRPIKVLFIGNSFSGNAPGLADVFPLLVNSTSTTDTVIVSDACYAFGQNFDKHYMLGTTMAKVRSGYYDYISLQGYANNGGDRANTTYYGAKMIEEARIVGSKPLVFMAQANITSPDKWDSATAIYRNLADSMHVVKVPCFPSWLRARSERPDYPTWDTDDHHQSDYGTYLNMYCMYAAITRTSPQGSTYLFPPCYNQSNPVTQSDATFMQRIAWETWQATAQDTVYTPPVDNAGPTVLSVLGYSNEGVTVVMNEMVSLATAQNVANYSVGGVAPSSARLLFDGRSVLLTMFGLSAGARTVSVSGLRDRCVVSNIMSGTSNTNTTVAARPQWTDMVVGRTPFAGSVSRASGTVRMEGVGNLGGVSDVCTFSYQRVSGDCSVTARVDSVEYTHEYARAGVQIRESEDPAARCAFVSVPAYDHGVTFEARTDTGRYCDYIGGTKPSSRPYWVRITRVGNTIEGFGSRDGTTWTSCGSRTITMGTNVLIGVSGTSSVFGSPSSSVLNQVSANGGVVSALPAGARIARAAHQPRTLMVLNGRHGVQGTCYSLDGKVVNASATSAGIRIAHAAR